MYYEFKMVDPALRKLHTETNQGEIFKVAQQSFELVILYNNGQKNNAQFTVPNAIPKSSQVLGREQREETRLAQLKESAATEKMEKAAFIIFLKGEDLLNMMFDVHKEKEELLLKMPQAKGKLCCSESS